MKNILSVILICLLSGSLLSQKYYTKEGRISFHSDAPLEKIEAENNKASSVIDTENGNIQWAVLIKAFQFEKALMQEHFNENYMESSKFPKSKFKGKILNIEDVSFTTDGSYPVSVSGQLDIHGVTNEIACDAQIKVSGGNIKATCSFSVLVADYDIKIPAVVKDNIAKTVDIKIEAEYILLDKS